MPKKKLTVKDVNKIKVKADKVEKKKPATKTINGKLVFKRMSSFGDLEFDVESDGVVSGKKISFYSFLPDGFRDKDLADYKITGSVTYKINVKKK